MMASPVPLVLLLCCTLGHAADTTKPAYAAVNRHLLQLLLGAQLVGVAALLLPAVLGTGAQTSITPVEL